MTIAGQPLAALNASLNATAFLLLIAGWRAICAGRIVLHTRLMIAAMSASAVFLACYLVRIALHGTHRFVGPPELTYAYKVMLGSHVLLAITIVPLVSRVTWLAYRKRYAEHRPLARFTLPIWLSVSATGVLVYLMLYHVSDR